MSNHEIQCRRSRSRLGLFRERISDSYQRLAGGAQTNLSIPGGRAAGPPRRSPWASRRHGADGRVQLQEQRVNNLLRRLEESRSHLAEAQRNYDRLQQEQQNIADAIRDPRPDGPPVAELQVQQRATQQELERLSADIQRMTAEATTLDADLAAEQGRWIDLNQRMEALEQSLVRK